MDVLHAFASASRQALLPSLPMPTQSMATRITGCCCPAASMMPRADNGSSTPLTGGTRPSHNGEPMGGVTSTLNVAIFSSTADALALHNVEHTINVIREQQSGRAAEE